MTKFLISAVVIVMLAMAGGVYLATSRVPSGDVTYENALVLETAEVPGSPRAYLFWYDTGAFGYTVRMVSLGKPSQGQVIIQSHYMTGMGWTAPDTLVVKLWRNEYRILNDRSRIVIVPHVTPE
jgi:hypothetical protein